MVVDWAMDAHRDEGLVEQASRMALARRQPDPGLLHHPDRGSQYMATDYRELLAQYGIIVSMSGKGDWYDNVLMESFFGTLADTRSILASSRPAAPGSAGALRRARDKKAE